MPHSPPFEATQQAIYTALTTAPAVSDGGVAVPVYGGTVPDGVKVPYILIGEDFPRGWNTKTGYGIEALWRIHIYTPGRTMAQAKRIATAVTSRLVDVALTITGHTCLGASLEASQFFFDVDAAAGEQYAHAVLDFRVYIQQT